jgi:pilus assembly protein Flp/PilA
LDSQSEFHGPLPTSQYLPHAAKAIHVPAAAAAADSSKNTGDKAIDTSAWKQAGETAAPGPHEFDLSVTKVALLSLRSTPIHAAARPAGRAPNANAENELRGGCTPLRGAVAHPLRLGGGVPRMSPRTNQPKALRRRRSIDIASRCHHTSGGVMSQLVAFVKSFRRNEEGQDLLEYALLVALIALVAIGAVGAAGGAVDAIFTSIAGALGGAA